MAHLDTAFTIEELQTYLCKIEATLNSRPLDILTKSVDDAPDYLTPGHFLVGSALLHLPEISLDEIALNRFSRWQLIRKELQSFWHRWRYSYLQTLMLRRKWTRSSSPPAVGDVVLVKKLNSPPGVWPLARIEHLFKDSNGVVRVARLKLADSKIARPVNSLLPIVGSKN